MKSVSDVSRYISPAVERHLWGIAAARCQFDGCNRRLNVSPVTKERGNYAQKAHIYAFSSDGPRGRGPYENDTSGLNEIENLMLVCYDCHKKIDSDKDGERYSAERLRQWKRVHERRIRIVTDVSPDKASHVLLYGARIGEDSCPLHALRAFEAMFPEYYPADDRALDISMHSASDDSTTVYWQHQQNHLKHEFDRYVRREIEHSNIKHLSVFGLAPQPLLIQLGSLITEKIPSMVYQLHREPPTWRWQPHPEDFEYTINEPADVTGTPVLVLSLSAAIAKKRVEAVLGKKVSVWELSSSDCHNDFLRSEAQLAAFRQVTRKLLAKINAAHPAAEKLAVFPAMPVSCAIELGRVRMPKPDIPWVLYDQNDKHGKFIKTIVIGKIHE
jgi:hypothetical protein